MRRYPRLTVRCGAAAAVAARCPLCVEARGTTRPALASKHWENRLAFLLPSFYRLVRELVVIPSNDLLVANAHAIELVTTCNPILMHVVGPAEQLQLQTVREHALYKIVYLVGLPGGLPNLADNDITIKVAIESRITFDANKAVLLCMVNPMACSPRADDALELVRLYPDDFLYSLVAPNLKTLPCQLHGSASHPQENHAIFVDIPDLEVPNLVVREGAIRQLHVDVPWRVSHDDRYLVFENRQGENLEVALNPLGRQLHAFHCQLIDTLRVGATILHATLV
mmetsp:Transcript_44627/g.123679  ORF Transcript_44627/g.123679 Transcript_44627/m.123679 type:complete len:282 (-) Transcript_44627:1318-2163(-)